MRHTALSLSVALVLAGCVSQPGGGEQAAGDSTTPPAPAVDGKPAAPPTPAHPRVSESPPPLEDRQTRALEPERLDGMSRRQHIAEPAGAAKQPPSSYLHSGPAQDVIANSWAPQDRERYQALADNPVQLTARSPVSTFSIDVDTGSYANVRRLLNAGRLPPADAVRVEEMINYFPYDYARPAGLAPFAVHTELTRAPWNDQRLLLRIAIKGQELAREALPPANLVFLVDVSGSMNPADKLPLLKSSLKLLVNGLRAEDRIALVTYASGTTVTLEPTPGSEKAKIINAIDGLRAQGSTAGASGIELAYRMAQQGFIANGINRILLATDGDFNVGVTDFRQLKGMVEERRKSGVSLSTLGFGTGNYNEQLMEQLADAGDGAYSYVDNLMEGHKVLVTEMTSTLATIARDVKIQVEFNPARVSEYRLVGYENRMLAREDFNNDQVDAGDIGAGHTVTALYELSPAGAGGMVDALRYGQAADSNAPARERPGSAGLAGELAHVKLRYKQPGEAASRLLDQAVRLADLRDVTQASGEFRFATAVAGFGQILRGGRYTGAWTIADARALAASGLGEDRFGYRAEAVRLMDLAGSLRTQAPVARN
jgi:Ca-activated chloride channel family protein